VLVKAIRLNRYRTEKRDGNKEVWQMVRYKIERKW
jgi:hypothetical protein